MPAAVLTALVHDPIAADTVREATAARPEQWEVAARQGLTDPELYRLAGACFDITLYLDALNNWYIRRSRDRFWAPAGGDDHDKHDAYDTLYTVLHTLTRLCAPLLPFVTEEVWSWWRSGSVHTQPWPEAAPLREASSGQDAALLDTVAEAAIALRQAGFEPVVAAMGTALTEGHLRELDRLSRRVFLCFDADAAGQTAIE